MNPYLNSNHKPTSVYDYPWLYCANDEISQKAGGITNNHGKWMMFFPKTEIDAKWEQAKDLYNQGKLYGIDSMKVSTNYQNPRASSQDDSVLLFYCGPTDDKERMMDIGQKLLEVFLYKAKFGVICYKSDAQTELGNKQNHLYKIQVPKN